MQTRLLHRTTRRVNLTENGKTVWQWDQRILEDIDRMTDAVSAAKLVPEGLLRICTSSGFGRNKVSPVISVLGQRYPSLKIELELVDRPVDFIEEGFYLDIRIGEVREPDPIARRIARNMALGGFTPKQRLAMVA